MYQETAQARSIKPMRHGAAPQATDSRPPGILGYYDKHQIRSQESATALGYRPLTVAYYRPKECWMLDNTIADMVRGSLDFTLVAETGNLDVLCVYR